MLQAESRRCPLLRCGLCPLAIVGFMATAASTLLSCSDRRPSEVSRRTRDSGSNPVPPKARPRADLANFRSGGSLRNADAVSHTVTLSAPGLSTAICRVKKPTKTMKNGLVPAHLRRVVGFEVRPSKDPFAPLSAQIRARAEVPCVCTKWCTVRVGTGPAIEVSGGKIVEIRGGKATVVVR